MRDRRILPEILDGLEPSDRRAMASRRDLRLINWLMGHRRKCRRIFGGLPMPGNSAGIRILEIGAGDGRLLLPAIRGSGVTGTLLLVDCVDVVPENVRSAWQRLGWELSVRREDVFVALEERETSFDVIFANLFLHHFETDALRRLFRAVARKTSVFVALEPRRDRIGLLGAACLPLLRCHPITRYDARVSVLGGFRGQELSDLWPDADWHLKEFRAGLFTHLFIASRHA